MDFFGITPGDFIRCLPGNLSIQVLPSCLLLCGLLLQVFFLNFNHYNDGSRESQSGRITVEKWLKN
jgi:hypothetical protein